MTDKIIFLDIDGPVIPYRCALLEGQTKIMTLFDPVAVGMLNHLCSEYGARIVIHSSWVRIMGGKETYDHCVSQGLKAEHFHEDAYCDENIVWRYTRVAEWLNRHPEVIMYAILDDEPWQDDMDETVPYPDGIQDHLVLVSYYQGFLFDKYNDTLAKLRSPSADL